MHGNHSIRNINNARVQLEIDALQAKATEARKQNHPKADEFQAQADRLSKEH
jgi:hypothetical protein